MRVRATAGQIALIEQEIDDSQDLIQSVVKLLGIRHPIRNPRVADLSPRPSKPLSDGAFGLEETTGDLLDREAADGSKRQSDLGFRRERRVTAGEDQAQPIIL